MQSMLTEAELKQYCDDYYKNSKDGIYYAHQPIYGYRTPYAEPSQVSRHVITRNILDQLAQYKFKQLIDISASEGYTSFLIQKLFGITPKITDWAQSVCDMANKLFGFEAEVADVKKLPYKDNEFEVVLCSETLEHVPDWRVGFDELLRITDKLLIVTVPHDKIEFVEYSRKHVPGGHINHFELSTFDFLKDSGYHYKLIPNMCPAALKARVLVEAYPKQGSKYALYNKFTPLFKKIFGKKSAAWLIDNDAKFVKATGQYGDIVIVVEKGNITRNVNYKPIKAADFMDFAIPHFYLDKV
jgi:ubiquinone/menaquinone biosynthesis C-methylase UbiE